MQTVLVIDPDVSARDQLVASLEQDYRVQQASDLDEAVICVRVDPPDLILTELPRKQLEYFHQLQYTWPDVPIVVVTQQVGLQTAVDAMRFGAIDYLVKPVSDSDLWVALGRARLRYQHSVSGTLARPTSAASEPVHHVLQESVQATTQASSCIGDDSDFQLATESQPGAMHHELADVLGKLRRALDALARCESADSLHEQILDTIDELFDGSPAELFLRSSDKFESVREADEVLLSHALLDQLTQRRSAVRVHSPPKHEPGAADTSELLEQLHLAAPMFDGDELLGVIALGSRAPQPSYSPSEQEVLTTFASLCVPWLKAHARPEEQSAEPQSFEALPEQLPTPIMLLDASRTITFASQVLCALTGHEQLEGHSAHILGDSFAEQVRGTPTAAANTECSIKHANGTEMALAIQVHLATDGYLWVTLSDPYAFLASRERLVREMQTWSVVASEVAHHVRNGMVPLQTLLEFTAESEAQDIPEALCESASESLTLLGKFMAQLEPFSEPSGPQLHYADLNIIVAKAIANAKRNTDGMGQLNVQYTEPLPLILADHRRLQGAVEKLVHHCIAHIPSGETLHILTTVEQSGDRPPVVTALFAYPVPEDEWGRLRATRWDVVLASVGQTLLEHGGVFDTRQTSQRIEHHLRFPVDP